MNFLSFFFSMTTTPFFFFFATSLTNSPFLLFFIQPFFFLSRFQQAIPWLGVLGNHDYGEQKPTKAEKKKLKAEKKRKEKKEKEKKERGAGGDAADDVEDEEEDDDDAPPRPSREKCAAALGATSNNASSSSSPPPPTTFPLAPQCSYGPLSQLDARLPERDPRWRVSRAFSLRLRPPADAATGGVSLSGFDTSPLVEKYRREAWARVPGGIRDQSGAAAAGLRELEAAIGRERRAGTRWRLAVGHHPFASLAAPLRTPELDPLLARPLRHSSAVFSGHDHTMQFLRWPRVAAAGSSAGSSAGDGEDDGAPSSRPPLVISGGGSDVGGRDDVNVSAVAPGSSFHPRGADAFFARRRGFADCVVTAAELRCDFVGGDGGVMFSAVVAAGEEERRQRGPPTPPPPPTTQKEEEKPLPLPQQPAAPDAAAASGSETTAATTPPPPPPHSPPAAPVVVAEPQQEDGRPQAAAEAEEQKKKQEAAASAAEGASSQQQQQEQQVDAPPRPPPVQNLNRR